MLTSRWLCLGVSAGCLGATSAALGKCAGLYFEDQWGLRVFLYILMVLANGGMLFLFSASMRHTSSLQATGVSVGSNIVMSGILAVAGATEGTTYKGGLRQKYVFEVAYDGTDFCGFQLQPSVPTVQGALERSLCKFLGGMHRDHLVVQGAARTDSGVHARQQYVEFYSNRVLDEERFVRAMNSLLPPSIVTSALSPVEDDFNVRFTNGKIYTYDIHLDKYRDPFTCRYRHVPKDPASLDVDSMRSACQSFVGLKDFRLLTNKSDRSLESSERLIYQCELGNIPGGIRVAVMGKGFLYKQVRHICGLLIGVGHHKLDTHDIEILLQGEETKLYNQKSQYQVAEGKGLCLQRVFLLGEQLPDSGLF